MQRDGVGVSQEGGWGDVLLVVNLGAKQSKNNRQCSLGSYRQPTGCQATAECVCCWLQTNETIQKHV
jgi:hypothetical protein